MGQNMKIIVHHDLTTLEIKKWVDKDILFTKSYSTQALRTQLASDFHFCTLKEALDIVSVQLFSAYKGINELFVIDPAVIPVAFALTQTKLPVKLALEIVVLWSVVNVVPEISK